MYGLGVSSSWSQVIPFCNHALCPNYAEWVHLYRVDSNFWKCRFLVLSKVEWYQSIYDFIIVSIQAICLQVFLGRCWAIRMLLIGSVHFWTDINWVLQIWGNLVMIAEMKKNIGQTAEFTMKYGADVGKIQHNYSRFYPNHDKAPLNKDFPSSRCEFGFIKNLELFLLW